MQVSNKLRAGAERSPVTALQWCLERRQREKEGRGSWVKQAASFQQMPNSLLTRAGGTRTSCVHHTPARNTSALQACVTPNFKITQRKFSLIYIVCPEPKYFRLPSHTTKKSRTSSQLRSKVWQFCMKNGFLGYFLRNYSYISVFKILALIK